MLGAVLVAVGFVAMLVMRGTVVWAREALGLAVIALRLLTPLALVALAVYLVWAARHGRFAEAAWKRGQGLGSPRTLTRSQTDRRFGGVCGGLAGYLGIDGVAVRVVFLLATAAFPPLLVVYLLLAFLLPQA